MVPPSTSSKPVSKRRQMKVYYTGKVQGVGFRYTAKTVATGYEITGQVRNLLDGRVELIAEGCEEELNAYRAALREAGLGGLIQDEQVLWCEPMNQMRHFEISR